MPAGGIPGLLTAGTPRVQPGLNMPPTSHLLSPQQQAAAAAAHHQLQQIVAPLLPLQQNFTAIQQQMAVVQQQMAAAQQANDHAAIARLKPMMDAVRK